MMVWLSSFQCVNCLQLLKPVSPKNNGNQWMIPPFPSGECTVHFWEMIENGKESGFRPETDTNIYTGKPIKRKWETKREGFSAHVGQRAPSFLDLGYGSTGHPGPIAPLSWYLWSVASENSMGVPYSSLTPFLGLDGKKNAHDWWMDLSRSHHCHSSKQHTLWLKMLSALFPRKPPLPGSVVFILHAVNSASQGIHEILKWRFQWKSESHTQPPQGSRSQAG